MTSLSFLHLSLYERGPERTPPEKGREEGTRRRRGSAGARRTGSNIYNIIFLIIYTCGNTFGFHLEFIIICAVSFSLWGFVPFFLEDRRFLSALSGENGILARNRIISEKNDTMIYRFTKNKRRFLKNLN